MLYVVDCGLELCCGLLIVDCGFVLPCSSSYRTGEV